MSRAPVSVANVQNTIVADTRHVNTQSVDVSISVCGSVDLRNFSIIEEFNTIHEVTHQSYGSFTSSCNAQDSSKGELLNEENMSIQTIRNGVV